MKKILYCLALCSLSLGAFAQYQPTELGQTITFKSPSAELSSPSYTVWVSSNSLSKKNMKIAVFTYADQLFDGRQTEFGEGMQIDAALARMDKALLDNLIIVGLNVSGANQAAAYIPNVLFDQLTSEDQQAYFNKKAPNGQPYLYSKLAADQLLADLEKRILPEVRQKYMASSKAEDLYLIGTEYGGLFAMYAGIKNPQLFQNVAAISTNWLATPTYETSQLFQIYYQVLEQQFPKGSKAPAIYMAMSTEGFDAYNLIFQEQINALFKAKKLGNHRFKYVEHHEKPYAGVYGKQAAAALKFFSTLKK